MKQTRKPCFAQGSSREWHESSFASTGNVSTWTKTEVPSDH